MSPIFFQDSQRHTAGNFKEVYTVTCALKEVSAMAKLKLHVFRLKMSAASYSRFEERC